VVDRRGMVPALSLRDQVDRLTERLTTEFSGRVPDPEVRQLVDEAYGEFADARVTQFVPVLIDRSVRLRLRDRTLAAAV
jgi:hypothetical protein